MKITKKQLATFVRLTKEARYHDENKAKFEKLGRKILKALAVELGLFKGEFDIRFNAGGIACSGDHTLHAEHVYIALHDNIGSGWFYFRSCKGRRDYSGGPNRIVYWNDFEAMGLKGLASKINNEVPRPSPNAIPA
jgi:hypothetical protein